MRSRRALHHPMMLLTLLIAVAGTLAADAGEAPKTWRQTGAMPASEAFQAAAADGDVVYAIANTVVAKYERRTGERLSVSIGQATHLNSGFVYAGRLYCAHSNFPAKPEQSQIKVLAPASMRLETFKDFGDYGGSLTWCVRYDGCWWWCNFARYGADNAGTFLVRFDDQWDERGRWTYPPEVIAKLGRSSLSGGLWRDGSLLVIGHDEPILFRLALPQSSNVLELIGEEVVPFPGQGIAVDPVTGGLVGIHRAKRQVIFAAAPSDEPVRLRVLTYNIHHGEGVDRVLDLERIARVIRSAEPDFVALQEVDRRVPRSERVDQPAELARLTDMQVVFGGNISLQGGDYGNALLSRFNIVAHTNHLLPRHDSGEQRGVLDVEIDVPGLAAPLRFLATHLDHRPPDGERVASARAVNALVDRNPERLALLAGDLNDVLGSRTMTEFDKHWQATNQTPMPSVPVKAPTKQIDFVLVRPATRWRVIETRVIDEPLASDHRPVLAIVEVLPSR